MLTAVESRDLQHDFRDVDVHRNSSVFKRCSDEAAESQSRHDAQGEGKQRVSSRQDRVHVGIQQVPHTNSNDRLVPSPAADVELAQTGNVKLRGKNTYFRLRPFKIKQI